MRRETILKFTSALMGISVLTMLLTPVLADPGNNWHLRWGYASDAGGPLPDGELITAWIDGVQYGDDLTIDGDGLFAIETDGDNDYGLGTEKEGGLLGDYIYYVHGDLTSASGGVFMTGVLVPEPWEVGGFEIFNEDLTDDPFTPELLKISKVSSQSLEAVDDYIAIYNPTGAAVDITTFSVAVGTGADQTITGIDIPLGTTVPALGLGYIDMAPYGGLSTVGNSVKLLETATGYIVDRVEYGTLFTEPENTFMVNAPAPGPGMEIYRVPADGSDTNNCSIDFVVGPVSNYTIPLLEGWNLISQPLIQSDEDLGVVLNDISGKWDCIQFFDALDVADHWKTNATFKPDQLNELKTLNHKMGFWINITESDVNLTVGGHIPTSTSINLYAGWNLVGYPTMTEKTVADALWGTGADKVEVSDPGEPYRIKEVGPSYVMGPGEGYWVHVPADSVWIVDW